MTLRERYDLNHPEVIDCETSVDDDDFVSRVRRALPHKEGNLDTERTGLLFSELIQCMILGEDGFSGLHEVPIMLQNIPGSFASQSLLSSSSGLVKSTLLHLLSSQKMSNIIACLAKG